jgi:acyl carrier protein
MTESVDIYAKVRRVLADSLGVDEDEITPAGRLQEDLGAESIDFLDIVFRLERQFGIKIPRGELFPESVFGNDPAFMQDGCVTDEGLSLLGLRMPYADLGGLVGDRRLRAVTDLFTVDFLVRYVRWKLTRADAGTIPAAPGVTARSGAPTHGRIVAAGA